MGLGDYLWPFQKNFSDIPCAREAAISALAGGVGLGAVSVVITNQTKYAYKTTVYGGFVAFWVAFIACRYQYAQKKKMAAEFYESMSRGDID